MNKELQDERFKRCVEYLSRKGVNVLRHFSPFSEGAASTDAGSNLHLFIGDDGIIYRFLFDENEEWELIELKA